MNSMAIRETDEPVLPPSTPIVGGVNAQKLHHDKMILDGVCTHCCHCALKLTDAVSVESGIGPICSKKGYSEPPVEADEMQAFIYLSAYPQLRDFLVERYKPGGVRGLVNGLVRVASLNRKTDVHVTCTAAIHALGYHKLASLLRESLATIEIKDVKDEPGYVTIWVKRDEWRYKWTQDLGRIFDVKRRTVKHGQGIRKETLIPINEGKAWTLIDGQKKSNLAYVWELMVRHYPGRIVKLKSKAVVISQETMDQEVKP